jgi:hypothetical protein
MRVFRLRMEYPSFPISRNASWEVNLQRLQRHATSGDGGEPELPGFYSRGECRRLRRSSKLGFLRSSPLLF